MREQRVNEAFENLVLANRSYLEGIGEDLSEIINQGEEVNDGQVVDQIIQYLKERSLYKEKGPRPCQTNLIDMIAEVEKEQSEKPPEISFEL